MKHIARLTLLAYPKAFRIAFGPSYLQAVADLEAHSRRGRLQIIGRLIGDALTTAPTMRWDNLMNARKFVLTIVAATAAAFGVVIGSPIVALPLLAIVGVLVIGARRHDQPIAVEAAAWGRRWYLWLAVAAVLFLVGFSMLLTAEDNELSSVAWAVWILSWLGAAITATVGVGLGATRLVHLRRA